MKIVHMRHGECLWCQGMGICHVQHKRNGIKAFCYCDCPVKLSYGRGRVWELPVYGAPITEGWGQIPREDDWLKAKVEARKQNDFERRVNQLADAYRALMRISEMIWLDAAKELVSKENSKEMAGKVT